MPNFVTSWIVFRGTKEDLEQVRKITRDFDFQKLKPMPKELEDGGLVSEYAFSALLYAKCGENLADTSEPEIRDELLSMHNANGYNQTKMLEDIEFIKKLPIKGNPSPEFPFGMPSRDLPYFKHNCGDKDASVQGDYLLFGQIWLDRMKKYGASNWSDWCLNNWGTKWLIDEGSMNIVEDHEMDELIYEFLTAWSVPTKIIELLEHELGKVRNLEMVWRYADGNELSNCGIILKQVGNDFFEYEDHAGDTDLMAEVLGGDPEDYADDCDEIDE